jgi:ubiquinone/menaquinone biosynthesis C-methylase UbiE/predicted transcriptional regulator
MRKPLPEQAGKDNTLFKLPYEVVKWELLKTAMELNVFEYLRKPATSETIAEMLALDPVNTEYMLNALAAIGCLEKKNAAFRNTSLAAQYLVSDQDTYLSDFLLFMEEWIQPILNGGMKNLIKNGAEPLKPVPNEDRWSTGARKSLNPHRTGRAQRIASAVSSLPEFHSISTILDLGAGSGIIGIAVTAIHPTARCILFDRDSVLKVAEEVIREYGMEERVFTMAGDYGIDPIGENYDLIIASQTLNLYRDRMDELIVKLFNALKLGGLLIVATDSLSNEKTAPESMVISWLPTALQGMDLSFEKGDIASAMIKAGFQSTQSEWMDDVGIDVRGETELIIARKANSR